MDHTNCLQVAIKSIQFNWETGTPRGPVYSFTRQQLTGKIIHDNDPTLYRLMEDLQTKLSLIVAGLDPTEEKEQCLKPKDGGCRFDISVLAAIPSKSTISK